MAAKLKKGDKVVVLTGKDKGKQGAITQVMPAENKAVVEGVNLVKKTVRKSQQFPEGKILDVPASIHLSNLMPYDPQAKKGVRISRVREDGKGVRVAKGTGHRFE